VIRVKLRGNADPKIDCLIEEVPATYLRTWWRKLLEWEQTVPNKIVFLLQY